jgi:hypothetical protein
MSLPDTTTDLDALLDALMRRAAERDQPPLVNVAGVEISPLATTGRLVVNSGDTILAQWGNTTYDQTNQCFDNAAQRDTQWPAPQKGARCYTDENGNGTMWAFIGGAWKSTGRGLVAAPAVGPSALTDCGASLATLASVMWTSQAGHYYRMVANGFGTQVSAAGQSILRLRDPSGTDWWMGTQTALPVNSVMGGGATGIYYASAGGTVSALLLGGSTGGALRVAANACRMWVEDLGTL